MPTIRKLAWATADPCKIVCSCCFLSARTIWLTDSSCIAATGRLKGEHWSRRRSWRSRLMVGDHKLKAVTIDLVMITLWLLCWRVVDCSTNCWQTQRRTQKWQGGGRWREMRSGGQRKTGQRCLCHTGMLGTWDWAGSGTTELQLTHNPLQWPKASWIRS